MDNQKKQEGGGVPHARNHIRSFPSSHEDSI